jgi:hypothetical protein
MLVIKQVQTPNTLILVETKDLEPLFTYYYDKDIFTDYYHETPRMHEKNVYFISSAEDVEALDLRKFNRVILTQTFEDSNPGNAGLLKYLSSHYKLGSEIKYYTGVNILAYSK